MNAINSQGKNIVLCSDGTGNSGGKGRGTNVWRLFQAIDLADGTQVAFHDDGVGTQDFKLVKAISGATGAGLGRNIRQLYASLVRVYDVGDRVYLFGFSRGAYTVRSLANFIDRFGILDRHAFQTSDDLESEILSLYDDYRRENRRNKGSQGEQADSRFCEYGEGVIAFLGVWDTVDAIGVPFDGLREWFRKYMPWKHHAYELNPSVRAAFHALAIDDERRTFDPTLFDETKHRFDPETVEQVWFAGVHSNVGGGYPKDQIAYNSLVWMMHKAADGGLYNGYEPLRFHKDAQGDFKDAANPHSKLYDSRSGLMAYYRFKPRDIEELCRDANAGTAKIHASAMERIARRTAGYAPFNIPDSYHVVDSSQNPSSPLNEPGPHELGQDKEFMQRAKGVTAWRTGLYAAFLIVTGLLVAVVTWQMLLYQEPEIPGRLSAIADAVKSVVPDILAGAVDAAFMRVGWLVTFAGLFGLMFWLRGFLKQLVRDLGGMGWRAAYLKAASENPSSLDDLATNEHREKKDKNRQKQRNELKTLRERVAKSTGAAIAWAAGRTGTKQRLWCIAWLAVFAGGLYLVGWHHPASDWADACLVSKRAEQAADGTWVNIQFETSNPCNRTGVPLQAGQRYQVEVSPDDWFDRTIAAGPSGFDNEQDARGLLMGFWSNFLRAEDAGFFVLMGQVIGVKDDRLQPLGDPVKIADGAEPIEAPATGELMLFANDVDCRICPVRRYFLYANNKGPATITVKELP